VHTCDFTFISIFLDEEDLQIKFRRILMGLAEKQEKCIGSFGGVWQMRKYEKLESLMILLRSRDVLGIQIN